MAVLFCAVSRCLGRQLAKYPVQRFALLKVLLRHYGKSEDDIARLTLHRQSNWVEVKSNEQIQVTLRDQKPLSDKGLVRALQGPATPSQWHASINSMVFFWPTKQRLETMLFTSAYEAMSHDVLAIDAKKLVQAERKNMRLSAINSGSTRPMAFPRDLRLFKTLED